MMLFLPFFLPALARVAGLGAWITRTWRLHGKTWNFRVPKAQVASKWRLASNFHEREQTVLYTSLKASFLR
jgi:hypothetical protein